MNCEEDTLGSESAIVEYGHLQTGTMCGETDLDHEARMLLAKW